MSEWFEKLKRETEARWAETHKRLERKISSHTVIPIKGNSQDINFNQKPQKGEGHLVQRIDLKDWIIHGVITPVQTKVVGTKKQLKKYNERTTDIIKYKS